MCAKWNIKYGKHILIRRTDAVDWKKTWIYLIYIYIIS